MSAWTLEKLLMALPAGSEPEDLRAVELKQREIGSLPKQLGFLKKVRKFDISTNLLTALPEVSKLSQLTQLNVAHNKITTLEPLATMTSLVVLNVQDNQLKSLKGVEGSANTLKALIAGDNALTMASVTKVVTKLTVLETLVLSKNPLGPFGAEYRAEALVGTSGKKGKRTRGEDDDAEDDTEANRKVPSGEGHPLKFLEDVSMLRKLSMAHCGIDSLPAKWMLPMITEVRFANNELETLPHGVILRSLHILDVANNKLDNFDCLKRNKFVKNITLHGNPMMARYEKAHSGDQAAINGDDGFRSALCRVCPAVKTCDGRPIEALSEDERRRAKRAALLEAQMAAAGEDDDEEDEDDVADDASDGAPVAKKATRAPANASTKLSAEERAAMLQEDDDKDVVVEPSSVTAPTKQIIRREKVHKAPTGGIAGANVLQQLANRNQNQGGW